MAPLTLALGVLAGLAPFALASPGCGSSLPINFKPGTSTTNVTISSKSVIGKITEREYILHLPTNYAPSNNKPAPLIFAFHGQLQPARNMEKISQLSDPNFNKDSIVVYPAGMNVQVPGVQWLGDVAAPNSSVIDDRIFVDEIRKNLTGTFCVDERRIYATGVSNGGSMVALLMCDAKLNKHFAAVSTVGGAFYPDTAMTEPLYQAGCNPDLQGRALPYLNLHGLSDKIVPYNGNNTPPFIPVREWVDTWVKRDNCESRYVTEVAENETVTDLKWKCNGHKDLVLHREIKGYGHGWPSRVEQGEPFDSMSGGSTKWDAAPYILNWFSKWATY
ncbi:carbohydrate esterase family 1 protein [Bipolaris oryzae ATCC 44560]|uniref:feruloyl esterase n=1 Tax=Bipolaris oryzae ATCC 44560 TaxID=930090 RepID=W6ZTH1_COCMI|nr:carbohydrate esterase family 1 protein [Bipolaris oryzae ATCC 44560]EUC47021.1 carbohydrate esterase family 1 protein [Bipolaris oryzae ATCC 44560]